MGSRTSNSSLRLFEVPRLVRIGFVFAGACLALLAAVAAWANQAGPAGDPQYFVEGLTCQGGKKSFYQ